MKPLLLLTSALLLAGAAQAHDTWFAPLPDGTWAFGTGNQFPKQESGIDTQYLRQHGCQRADGSAQPLTALDNSDTALLFKLPADAANCWVQLTPFEVTLAPDKIGIYMNEVRPPQAMLDAWAGMHARGLPWKEHYTKHARVQRNGTPPTQPDGTETLGMDARMDSNGQPLQVGKLLNFQVLRDGAPLPDFAVEFRSDRTAFGLWRRTDAQGRLQFQPPLPGEWILRGVDLRLSDTTPDTFDSRFITLAFVVAARTATP